jgi:hypothetical protein
MHMQEERLHNPLALGLPYSANQPEVAIPFIFFFVNKYMVHYNKNSVRLSSLGSSPIFHYFSLLL